MTKSMKPTKSEQQNFSEITLPTVNASNLIAGLNKVNVADSKSSPEFVKVRKAKTAGRRKEEDENGVAKDSLHGPTEDQESIVHADDAAGLSGEIADSLLVNTERNDEVEETSLSNRTDSFSDFASGSESGIYSSADFNSRVEYGSDVLLAQANTGVVSDAASGVGAAEVTGTADVFGAAAASSLSSGVLFAAAVVTAAVVSASGESAKKIDTTAAPVPRVYSIDVLFGPMTDSGANTSVFLYKADGTLLGEAKFSSGKFIYEDKTGYTGIVIARMVDGDTDPDYRDEATGELKSADGVYLAVTTATGTGGIKININPLTTAAANAIGITDSGKIDGSISIPSDIKASGTSDGATNLAVSKVNQVNKAIALAFNILDASGNPADLVSQDVKTVVSSQGTTDNSVVSGTDASSAYGRALAIVSHAEKTSGKSTAQLAADVSKALDVNTGTLTSTVDPQKSADVQSAIIKGIASAQASAQVTSNQAQAVTKSVTASEITLVVNGADDAFLKGEEDHLNLAVNGIFVQGQVLKLYSGTNAIDFTVGSTAVVGGTGYTFTASPASTLVLSVAKSALSAVDAGVNLKAELSAGTSGVTGTSNSNNLPVVVDGTLATPNAQLTTDSTNLANTAFASDNYTNNGAITAPTNTETNAKVEYRVTKDSGTAGAWSTTYTAPATNGTADGVYKVEIRQTDLAGNANGTNTVGGVNALQTINFTLDTTKPSANLNAKLTTDSTNGVTGKDADGITSNAAITAPTNAEDGAKVEYRVTKGSGSSASIGTWSTTYAAPTAGDGSSDGAYKVEVRQTDKAGNVGDAQAVNFTLDQTKPSISSTALSVAEKATAVGSLVGSDTNGITWTLDGTSGDNDKFTLVGGALAFKSAPDFETPASAAGTNAYTVNVKATDGAGNVSTKAITVNVTDVNDAPTASGSIGAQTAVKGQSSWQLSLAGYFADVDATDTRSYALTSGTLPTGLTLNPTSGVISGTPSAEAASGSFTVTMTDKGGQTATQTFSLKVVAAPVINSFTVTDDNAGGGNNAAIGKSGDALTFAVTLSEEVTITGSGTPKITFTVGGVDVVATYVSASANVLTFTGTAPSTGNGGSVTVKSIDLTDVTVTGKTSTQPWQTGVVNQSSAYTLDNTNPAITTETLSVAEKATAVGSLVGSDTNGITWTLDGTSGDNDKFTLVGGALAFKSAPDFETPASAAGTNAYTVNVKATDGAGNVSTKAITVNVTDVNEAPTVSGALITDVVAVTGTVYTVNSPLTLDGVGANISSYFIDPDTTSNFSTLTYSLDAGAPAWLQIDPTTGKLFGAAPSNPAADLSVTVNANDGSNTVSKSFSIDLVSLPALKSTQVLDNVANLDVKSALVLEFSAENLALGSGQIRIKDDMGATGLITRNTTVGIANNSKQDVTDNDVVITLTNGVVTDLTVGTASYTTFGGVGLSLQRLQDSVKVSGSKLIIDIGGADATTWGTNNTNWNFDWDFGANYHVEFDAGVVKAGAGGPANLAMTNDQTLNFTTVTPADGSAGAASQKMDSNGALSSGYIYHNAHQGSTAGGQAGAIDLNFATGAHALVVQLNSVSSSNPQYIKTSLGGNIDVAGFGIDDVIYNDNGGNMLLKSIEGLTGTPWSGSGSLTTGAAGTSTLKRTVDTDVSGQATWTWFGDATYTVSSLNGDSNNTAGFEARLQSNAVIFG
ncbi:hypothetical protein AEP_01667 [Curvibacter sp. AEP1-3]|uniref:beta strand repeat-containing protein n=1 Tax=Curvibacter sp. AEP1-3 TaxID=1844971 RepID=UPI000B3BE363|nr:putative Ig domain-containing protein [Curvibacter sp. AEP1-3]ARV18611.1 hypothetical protein AEP_01667 [Curvibacter sp. AEP1-3]